LTGLWTRPAPLSPEKSIWSKTIWLNRRNICLAMRERGPGENGSRMSQTFTSSVWLKEIYLGYPQAFLISFLMRTWMDRKRLEPHTAPNAPTVETLSESQARKKSVPDPITRYLQQYDRVQGTKKKSSRRCPHSTVLSQRRSLAAPEQSSQRLPTLL